VPARAPSGGARTRQRNGLDDRVLLPAIWILRWINR
jgi:hypothetical protein